MNLGQLFPRNMRLGQYESRLGQLVPGAPIGAPAPLGAPASVGGVGGVLTGVGAILGPLAGAFATGYSAQLQINFQKDQLRNQQNQSFAPPSFPFIPPPPPRSGGGAVIAIVGILGLLAVVGIVMVASKKKKLTAAARRRKRKK